MLPAPPTRSVRVCVCVCVSSPQDLQRCLRELDGARLENAELKLQMLEWRKAAARYRLKHACVDDSVKQYQENQKVLTLQLSVMVGEARRLEQRVADLGAALDAARAERQRAADDVSRQQVRRRRQVQALPVASRTRPLGHCTMPFRRPCLARERAWRNGAWQRCYWLPCRQRQAAARVRGTCPCVHIF